MQVGQQVVCIDGKFPLPLLKYYEQTPEKGKVYTIRAVHIARGAMHVKPGTADGEVGLLLQELKNPVDPRHKGQAELGFNSNRFKLLDEREAVEELVEKSGKTVAYKENWP